MTLVLQKFHRTFSTRLLNGFESEFEAYKFDSFYRFVGKIPFKDLVNELSAGTLNNPSTIYLTASLVDPKIRKVDYIRNLQMMTFYVRPGEYGAQLMSRITECPQVIFAGFTISGGIRFGIPITLDGINFSTLPTERKSQVFFASYKKLLAMLRTEYSIGGIKPTTDILECLNPLQPQGFYDNSQHYQLFHL